MASWKITFSEMPSDEDIETIAGIIGTYKQSDLSKKRGGYFAEGGWAGLEGESQLN